MYKKQLSSLREKLNNRILRPIKKKKNTEIQTLFSLTFKVELKGIKELE